MNTDVLSLDTMRLNVLIKLIDIILIQENILNK